MTLSPPRPRKQPRQRRAIETCAAIIEAAARILEGGGPEELNTNRIAERAGVSIGTLYQYFPDKQAILVALIRREREALLQEMRAIPQESGDALRAMVDASIRHQFARPDLARSLELIEVSFPLDAEAAAMAHEIAAISSGLLARRFGRIDQTDLLTAVVMGRALVNAAGQGMIPFEALAERVVLAIAGYLEKVAGRSAAGAGN